LDEEVPDKPLGKISGRQNKVDLEKNYLDSHLELRPSTVSQKIPVEFWMKRLLINLWERLLDAKTTLIWKKLPGLSFAITSFDREPEDSG
jgi:hypothetical protein